MWYLTDQEECELEKFFIGCTRMGFGRTRQGVILKSWTTAAEGFCRRHPNIRLRIPADL